MNPRLNPKLYTKKVELVATRSGAGQGLLEAGRRNKNVIVLCADLTESTKIHLFAEKFPERFIECGVAEQNMMSLAAGLAREGKIPFVASYAVFSPGRNWDQLRTNVCYNNVPVKILSSHTGLSVGADGATHQALEDIALCRVLPNMIVLAPCDALEAKKACLAAAKERRPVYLRLTRPKTPVITTPRSAFKIGKAQILNPGKDVTVCASGPMLYDCLVAAKKLKSESASVEVINNHTIKPLDKKTILASVKKTGCVVTAEDHQVAAGAGSAILEMLAENFPVPAERVGVKDAFGESGEPDQLLEKHGLNANGIERAIKKVLKRK